MIKAAAERGIAVLMTTHDLHRVSEVAHRLGIMRSGSLVVERDASALSLRRSKPFTWSSSQHDTHLLMFEWRMLWRERRVLACSPGSCSSAVIVAAAAQFLEVQRGDREKAEVAHLERSRWLSQGEKDPHSAAHYSIYAFKPSAPLAVLDPGIESYVGQAVWLEAHVQNDLLYRPKGEATALQRAAGMGPPASWCCSRRSSRSCCVTSSWRGTGIRALAGIEQRAGAVDVDVLTGALIWLVLGAALVLPVAIGAGLSAAASRGAECRCPGATRSVGGRHGCLCRHARVHRARGGHARS